MSTVSVELTYMECGKCGVTFAMPEILREECERSGNGWYCPNGHPRVYRKTVREKLREAEDALARSRAYADQLEASNRGLRGANTRQRNQLKRVKHGVCPCCKRSFQNLVRHMETKHPDYDPEGGS